MPPPIEILQQQITDCRRCRRLVTWREKIAVDKRASFCKDIYWGRAVPGFGDPRAKVLIVGLAPAAHGANRTGRMFTGDRSGEWLYRAIFKAGFSNQPTSINRRDTLNLDLTYITAVVKCAPPANKPTTEEKNQCITYLKQEIRFLKELKVIVALGKFAWDGVLKCLAEQGLRVSPKPIFSHAQEVEVGPYILLGSFHPSQQNTFTGKLTEPMFDAVFKRAKNLTDSRK